MLSVEIDGINIAYELRGSGLNIALIAGGLYPMEVLRELAKNLARRYRVLIYDRRNTGQSDIVLNSDQHEFEHFADDLYALLRKLDLLPCYLGGGSAGSIISFLPEKWKLSYQDGKQRTGSNGNRIGNTLNCLSILPGSIHRSLMISSAVWKGIRQHMSFKLNTSFKEISDR